MSKDLVWQRLVGMHGFKPPTPSSITQSKKMGCMIHQRF